MQSVSIITTRKRSCGKVQFLHLSVILLTGEVSASGTPPGQTPKPPVEMTIEACSMHPTGKHSYLAGSF